MKYSHRLARFIFELNVTVESHIAMLEAKIWIEFIKLRNSLRYILWKMTLRSISQR